MSYAPALVLPVVVTTSNKWIDFTAGSTPYTAQLTVGTYYSLASLATMVETRMEAEHTAGYTISYSTAEIGAGVQAWGLKLNAPTSINILWLSGSHNASNAYSILGFTKEDTGASDEMFATYSMPNVWIANRPPASDTYDRRKHVGGDARESLNGAHHVRLAVARPRTRKVEFEAIDKRRTLDVHATGTYTNMAFESFWERAVTGEQFAYFNDWTRAATAAQSSGNYYLMEPDDLKEIKRPHVDYEVYSFGITMQRKE